MQDYKNAVIKILNVQQLTYSVRL